MNPINVNREAAKAGLNRIYRELNGTPYEFRLANDPNLVSLIENACYESSENLDDPIAGGLYSEIKSNAGEYHNSSDILTLINVLNELT